jgi:hypothetical protein
MRAEAAREMERARAREAESAGLGSERLRKGEAQEGERERG